LRKVDDEYDRRVHVMAIDKFESLSTTAYVTSFSERGNLLSQWRAYAPRNGFSVGFDASALARVEGCTLVRCLYLRDDTRRFRQRTLFNRFLDHWIAFR